MDTVLVNQGGALVFKLRGPKSSSVPWLFCSAGFGSVLQEGQCQDRFHKEQGKKTALGEMLIKTFNKFKR